MKYYEEAVKNLGVREFDVVVAGGGTAGVVAALASARQGAKTALIEGKGYMGGTIVEGGTALHSFYNLWKPFPNVKKRQVVKGIPQEIIDRLAEKGATSGHTEVEKGIDYDCICTLVDPEIYKLVVFEMLIEAGVKVFVNTHLVSAIMKGSTIEGVITESRAGREAFLAKAFVDCTGYGDLSAFAGADYNEPNDHAVANSIGVGGVSVEKYHEYLKSYDAVIQYCEGPRDGEEGKIIRIEPNMKKMPTDFVEAANSIGLHTVTTTLHDDYFMFIKLNLKMSVSPTDRDAVAEAELELRRRQFKAIEFIKKYIPGCEKAFIARSSPALNIRRGRQIVCDYDISIDEIIEGIHFEDEIMVYGFHDSAPRLQIKNGRTYGIPYRALCVSKVDNLLAAGMIITSNRDAHMSTRNTVCAMGQGQAAGTAAALSSKRGMGTRELPYAILRETLEKDGVYFDKPEDNL